MNNHLKLILYIVMIAGIFLFVQDRFELFDVSWKEELSEEIDKVVGEEEGDESEEAEEDQVDYVEITIPNGLAVRVEVDIADSDGERSRGLSGRRYLGDYEGMLFVYDAEVRNTFWMQDMLIPLDIIFIDSQNYIVDIAVDQQPCTDSYCPPISSKESYMYVLEVNAGFSEVNSIEEGYRVVQYLQ